MGMNIWDCDADGCRTRAMGSGGAIGLSAIGWFVREGHRGSAPTILCPEHHPYPGPCTADPADGEEPGKECSVCKAEKIAKHVQEKLPDLLLEVAPEVIHGVRM